MSDYSDPSVDMVRLDMAVLAFMDLHVANTERSLETGHEYIPEKHLSPLEANLYIALLQSGFSRDSFVCQQPFGPYSADFFFPEAKLVVEIDGKKAHAGEKRRTRRDDYLLENGADAVMHFPGTGVSRYLGECVKEIQHFISPPENSGFMYSFRPELHSRIVTREGITFRDPHTLRDPNA